MKKLTTLFAGALMVAGTAAMAERYVVITHTQGTDPFWPVVEKGAKDAAAAVGAEIEYNFDASGDMAGMAKLIEAAAASQPDGIVVSLPDAAALGPAIKEVGAEVHLSCFDLSPGVMDMIEAGDAAFTIDQQQRLQGYMPIIVLHLYNNHAGLLPGANIPSGPGFVDQSNAAAVKALAGVDR